MSHPLSDALQIWGFEDNFILFSDGSLGFGLEISPLDVDCWEDGSVDNLASRIGLFLNGLPEGIDLQFVQDIGPGNEPLIRQHEKLECRGLVPAAKALHDARVSTLLREEQEEALVRHRLRVLVRRKPQSASTKKPSLFSRPKLFLPLAADVLERELASTCELRDEIERNLLTLGVNVLRLNEKEIAELIYEQWNPTRDVELVDYDPEEVRSSLLFTDAVIYETGFSLGGLHHRVVSLKMLPDQTFASMARTLRELPFGSRLFLSIHVPNQQKELGSLQTQRRLAFSMARGKQTGVSDLDSEAKLEDLERLLNEMIAQGEKIFHMSFNVLLRSSSEEDLRQQVSETLMKMRSLSGAEGMEETLACFDIFCELSLPNARATERAKRVKTSNLADFIPLYGPWGGHEKPSILLKSYEGSLVSFDPFSPSLANFNQIVTGGSGSGKSFLTNCLMLQMLKENPKVFIVDIGGSYRKLTHHLSGQNIPLSLDEKISLNPFDLPLGETIPSNHKIKFLVGLIEMMTKEEDQARIGRLERAEMEQAILQVYQTSSLPGLSALRAILLRHPKRGNSKTWQNSHVLVRRDPFGQMVDRPTTLRLERPIVAFDLKGLETYPDLQVVCLYLITDFVGGRSGETELR